MATHLALPTKDTNETNFTSQTGLPNISTCDKSNCNLPNKNDYDNYTANAVTNVGISNTVLSNNESFHMRNDSHSVETPSPYPCMDVHEGDSLDSSKQTSASVSPLVVLPLPDETLSKETKNSSNTTFTHDINIDHRTSKSKRIPQQMKHTSRVNELAEYAKQYEDLYTRRMGTLNCNSSTSGSVPSPAGSSYRYQRQSFCNTRTILNNEKEQINLSHDGIRSPALSVNSSLPTQSVDENEYVSFSKTHQNVIQWVQNQHTFASEASVTMNLNSTSNSLDNDFSWKLNHQETNNLHFENKTGQKQLEQINSTSKCSDIVYNNSPKFPKESPTSKPEGVGDPNQSGLPNVEIIRKPGGVKSLVSAFNKQIESQKVKYF